MDIARWFLGQAAVSPRVISIGGRLGYDDDGATPNTQLIYHAYEGPPLVFEVRGLPTSATRTSKPWPSKKRVNQRPICPLPPMMAIRGFI